MPDAADSILTVIPAKAGSTRLPGKNMALLAGKPLLLYTIEAAKESGVCGEIMVSTESEEIARLARRAGAMVPFMRPKHLGQDPYGVVDVCLHVLEEYEKRGRRFRKLITLLPTSPLRSAQDIRGANALFEDKKAEFVMGVAECSFNPFQVLRFQDPGILEPCFPELVSKKRHQVPRTYLDNGAVYIVQVEAFRQARTYYGRPLYGYVMPWDRSIDIDTEQDLMFAEFLMERRRRDGDSSLCAYR